MKVYKVCWQPQPGVYVSACKNPSFCESYRVCYYIGEAADPILPRSKLFAFKELVYAKDWIEKMDWEKTHVVLECEAEGVQQVESVPLVEHMIDFWIMKKLGKAIPNRYWAWSIPHNTVWCDSIKPLALAS